MSDFNDETTQAWYFERDSPLGDRLYDGAIRKIYIKNDPAGHKYEISVTGYAFSGPRITPPEWPPVREQSPTKFPYTDAEKIANNVTVRNLIIEKFANPGQFGAVGFQDPGTT